MSQRDEALEIYSEDRDLLSAKIVEHAQCAGTRWRLAKTPQRIDRGPVDIDWHEAIRLTLILSEIESEIYSLVNEINSNAEKCGKPCEDATNTNLD
jgi:hypothetical protein